MCGHSEGQEFRVQSSVFSVQCSVFSRELIPEAREDESVEVLCTYACACMHVQGACVHVCMYRSDHVEDEEMLCMYACT